MLQIIKFSPKILGFFVVLLLATYFSPVFPVKATVSLIHQFSGGVNGGSYPYGDLYYDGTKFYGMTYQGGDSNVGTIFSIDIDGSNFALLHEFAGGVSDGSYPSGSLVSDGSKLYGYTYTGGSSNFGTIFSIDKDGTNFTILHSFSGGTGSYPQRGSLTLSGSKLYGMTYSGGSSTFGVIYSIDTNGSNFTVLHNFTGGGTDGKRPYDNTLTLSGSNLYGMTQQGGDSNAGTIFSIDTNGNNFTLLHEFAGGASDGADPYGHLLISGTKLME